MDALFAVYMSLRKFFGALIPGIVWLDVGGVLFPAQRDSLVSLFRPVLPGTIAPFAFALIVAYLVGNTGTWVSFRILEMFGEWVGARTARVRRGSGGERFLMWCEQRLHLLDRGDHRESLRRADREIREVFGVPLLKNTEGSRERTDALWALYGLYLRHHAPALAAEDREVEAEANFTAGMFLPLLLATMELLRRGQWWALSLLVVLIFLALRFQHTKNYEGELLAWS